MADLEAAGGGTGNTVFGSAGHHGGAVGLTEDANCLGAIAWPESSRVYRAVCSDQLVCAKRTVMPPKTISSSN